MAGKPLTAATWQSKKQNKPPKPWPFLLKPTSYSNLFIHFKARFSAYYLMLVKIKLKKWALESKRETDSVTSCKNSHPRLNKQGCKWENDDTIQLHKIK